MSTGKVLSVDRKVSQTGHMPGRDSVRSLLCLRVVGRLEESTTPSGAVMLPGMTLANRPRSQAARTPDHRDPNSPRTRIGTARAPKWTWARTIGVARRATRARSRMRTIGVARQATRARDRPGAHSPPVDRSIASACRATMASVGAPRTSHGASWSKIPRPLVMTSESAKSRVGSRPTMAYRSRAHSGRSASPAHGCGAMPDTIGRSLVGPTSARAVSGCTSGACPKTVRTADVRLS
jgi:hypothetical protein